MKTIQLRSYLSLLLVTLMAAMPITSIASSADNTVATTTVGVIVPLTGGWSAWGETIRNALTLINEDPRNSNLKFDYEDEGSCDAAKAVSGYHALRARTELRIVIIGCMNSARALIPLAKRDRVLLLGAGFQDRDIFKSDSPFINLALQIDSEAAVLAQNIESSGVSRLALLRASGTDDLQRTMKLQFAKSSKVEIISDQSIAGDEADLAPFILKIRSLKVDGLYLNLTESQLLTVLKKLRSEGSPLKLFSTYGMQGLASSAPEIRELAPDITYSYPTLSDSSTAYNKLYLNRFGRPPPFITASFLQDGVERLESAISTCGGTTDTKCLHDQIADNNWHSGVSGRFRINSDGSIDRDLEIRNLSKRYSN